MDDQGLTQHVPLTSEEGADIKKSYQGIEKAGLEEALILAAQQQELSTSSIETVV